MAITDFNTYKPIEVTSATNTPTISRALCFKINSGDDTTTGTGEIVLDWSNISSQADIGVYDENDNLLDYYFESFDATNETAVIWVYRDWVRDGSVQAKIAYGDGPSDQSVVASTVFDKESNLQAGYLFNETSGDLKDVTSNNNDGTVTGATQGVDGIVGGAYSFDGTDDQVSFSSSVFDSTIAHTVECWIYPRVLDSNWRRIVNTNDNDNGFSLLITNDNQWRYRLENNGNRKDLDQSVSATNKWFFLQCIYDGSSLEFRINGATAVTGSGSSGGDPLNLSIGDGTSQYVDALIASVSIFSTNLSIVELDAYYSATKSSPDFFSQQVAVVVCTDSPTNITSFSATLNGTLNDLRGNSSLDVYFEYGTDTSYGNTTATQPISSVPTSFSADISGLTAFATYHYRAVATDGTNYWYGSDVSFYTTDLGDIDETQSDFQNGTLSDVVATFDGNLEVGTVEEDGDVSEFSELSSPASHQAVTSTYVVGNYSRKIQSNNNDGSYDEIQYDNGSEISPSSTIFYTKVPNFNNDDWPLKIDFRDSSDVKIMRISFDGDFAGDIGAEDSSGSVLILSSYTANVWYKIEIVWDWTNETFGVWVDDVEKATGLSFQVSCSGFRYWHEFWDHSNGGITGYIDHEGWPLISSSPQGNRVVQLDLSSLNAYSDSLIEWTVTLNGQSLTIETRYSLDGGSSWSSWQTATSGDPIPGLSGGEDLSNALLECRETLSTSDATSTPQLERRAVYLAELKSFELTFPIVKSNSSFITDLSFQIGITLPIIKSTSEFSISSIGVGYLFQIPTIKSVSKFDIAEAILNIDLPTIISENQFSIATIEMGYPNIVCTVYPSNISTVLGIDKFDIFRILNTQ